MFVLQEGEEGKEEEEKEFLGKLEYTLDYSFTDNQVRVSTAVVVSTAVRKNTNRVLFLWLVLASTH